MAYKPSESVTAQPADGRFLLRDGRCVVLRPVTPSDARGLAKLSERLSPESSRLRFSRAGRRLTVQEALDHADIDHDCNEAVVAVQADLVVGWASFNRLGGEPHAELTLLVEDGYQGAGLGRRLLSMLIDAARARLYTMLMAELLPDNDRMLRLLETAGVSSISDLYYGVLRVYLFL